MPPPAPDPTIHASYTVAPDRLCIAISLSRTGDLWAKRYRRAYLDANQAPGRFKGDQEGQSPWNSRGIKRVRALGIQGGSRGSEPIKGSEPLIPWNSRALTP